MDFNDWFNAIGAVLTANLLTIWFGHSLWVVSRVEKLGMKAKDAPWHALFGIIIPPLIATVTAYMVKV